MVRAGRLTAGALGLCLLTAGCQGGGGTAANSTGGATEVPAAPRIVGHTPTGEQGGRARLMVTTVGSLGQVLTDGAGYTLYDFVADHSAASTCYDACAVGWPPLLTKGAPAIASGVQSALVGTTARKDGTTQVTYAGHPLYYFFGDHAAGSDLGQNSNSFGALWFALRANGAEVR